MTRRIEKVAVLGAGVMGSGIAAHLANAGIPSLMYDLERPDAAMKALLKQKPAPLFHKGLARMIEPCSFGADSERFAECDWIVEVVTERLDIKRKVFENVRKHARPGTIVTSNTSGIPISAMTEGAPEDFKKNFFVTHFFNPVRYMKLLELVAGPDTDPELYEWFKVFGERTLGKGIVDGKDTPNFVANRIGTYGLMSLLHKVQEAGFNVAQIDGVFGKPMGRPRSAIFRTADLVGLDTLSHVADNCYQNLPNDPRRDAFLLPDYLKKLIERGDLGGKTGGGFYKKTKVDGKKKILALNLDTMEYEDQGRPRFDAVGATRDIEDPKERIAALLDESEDITKFAWDLTADTLLYAASLLGEIADDVVNIDNAMKWGFGWGSGPFETWDAMGLERTTKKMRDAGMEIPAVVDTAIKAGGWYQRANGVTSYLDIMGDMERHPVPAPKGAIFIKDVKEAGKVVSAGASADILDLGDGVLGLEFHSKMNTIDNFLIQSYNEALDLLDGDWNALVVANEGDNFSVGANVMLVAMAASMQQWGQIEELVKNLQDTCMRAKHHAKPVITAPHQMALGGGAEMTMHSSATQATGELYIGQVEVGVGLLPAAGGCKELIFRHVGSIPEGVDIDTNPFVQRVFMLIGMAHVATSAGEAMAAGFLRPSDGISMNRDLQIHDAKQRALGMINMGWRRPPQTTVKLPGRSGVGALESAMWGMKGGGQISDYDMHVGKMVANVLCGGNIAAGTKVTEQDLLDLEREAFLSLCGEEKTMARIQHMLRFNKPLRN
jgi:3-hydroxyacyl-CoA dehydrogenase